MITYSGVHIQTVGGASGTPSAQDIAVHAGRLCRFGGAVWYPLLPHLVFVGLLAYQRSGHLMNLLWGFLHDAHETVTADVPRPFKCDCMRREQAAIDRRILEKFIGYKAEPLIDYKLVKQCDNDALDIEAVELRLPGFAGLQAAIQGHVYSDGEDAELFRRILASPFAGDTIYPDTQGVRAFQAVLELAEGRKRDSIIPTVQSWGLLDGREHNDLPAGPGALRARR